MSELLYNKSKAVEELNKVEGFYPLELARVISNEGQEEQRYLDVKYAADSQSVSRNHAIISASSNSGAADDGTVLSRSTSQWKYDWRGNGYRTDDKSGNESGNWICTSYAADAF